ncbi:MAG: nitroreductase family protein [Oscillospiraceae bacterium]|jgi:nitroreductase|nr:nitroreductase family protein [Oscillospiraceae bacterium]
MSNPVLTAISERRSIRAYAPEQITQAQLDALIQAALESPSAHNSQPWHFSVVQSRAILDELNAETGKTFQFPDLYYGAPTVIFISIKAEGQFAALASVDAGIAVENIALAAQSLGLGSVILGLPALAFTGERAAYFKTLLKFPEGNEFIIAIAVGTGTATKEPHPVEPGKVDILA